MGGDIETWADTREIYAEITEESGSRNLEGGQVRYYKTYNIQCRRQPDLAITPDNRIKYGTKIFVIDNVLELDSKWLEITAGGND